MRIVRPAFQKTLGTHALGSNFNKGFAECPDKTCEFNTSSKFKNHCCRPVSSDNF